MNEQVYDRRQRRHVSALKTRACTDWYMDRNPEKNVNLSYVAVSRFKLVCFN